MAQRLARGPHKLRVRGSNPRAPTTPKGEQKTKGGFTMDYILSKIKRKHVAWGVSVVLLIVLVFNVIAIVPYNHVGILLRAGVVQNETLPEGWRIKIPFVDGVEVMSNQVQSYRIAAGTEKPTTSETAETKDRQLIPTFEFEVLHQLSKNESFKVFQNYGKNYADTLIGANAVAIIKQVFSTFDAEEIVTNKETIPDMIAQRLNEITKPVGVTITRVNMKTYDFTPEYTAILEERAMLSAQLQNNEIKQNNERIAAQTAYDVAVKQSQKEAETASIKAQNDKEVALINAEADAEAKKLAVDNEVYIIKTRAEAEKTARLAAAEATRAELEAQAAGLNEMVIQKLFMDKWDGRLIPSFGNGSFSFADMTDIIKQYLPRE